MRYLILLFILLALNFISADCQSNAGLRNITISSPNAASLGKYGDIPVSNHTGIPDIGIPFYTVKSGPLELPISLSNHASGLKVQEQASWVGAGWTLNAGGVITRTVMGAPDDKGLNAAGTDKGYFSDYGYSNYLFSPGPSVCTPNAPLLNTAAACPIGSTYTAQDGLLQSGKLDGEPDYYFFNFNGHSGKFYFNDDRTVILLPEQDVQITPIYPGTDYKGITGFIITTADGTKYYFGQNQNNDGNIDATEVTYYLSTQQPSSLGQGATSSWYLNKIVSADGLFAISLVYQAENYSYYTLSMYSIPGMRNPNPAAFNSEYDLYKNFINGVKLSKIVFPNGEVDFNTGNLRQDLSLGYPNFGGNMTLADQTNNDSALGARVLGSMSVSSNRFCKKFTFSQSYFYDPSSLNGYLLTVIYPSFNIHSDQYRLRLDSIQESSCDNSVKIPSYKFNYFTGIVPRKLSFGLDHWGFYNGVSTNTGLIPTYTVVPALGTSGQPTNAVSVVQGADRDSHWPYSLNGSLQQIIYPTGGNTTFDFESNSVYAKSSQFSNTTLANIFVGLYGQAARSMTSNITVDGSTNSVNISITTSLNYSSSLEIKDNNGNIVFNDNISNWDGFTGTSSNSQYTISLPQGIYQAILSEPTYSNVSGSVQVLITQWQQAITNSTLAVGGIRIKTITSNDVTTAINLVTNYGYNFNNLPNGQSSGLLFSRPVYVQAIRNDVWGIVGGAMCSITGCLTCFGSNASYYQSPSSIRPMSTTNGNHIGYGEVYISQTGNGYTAYKYYGSNGSIPHLWDTPLTDVCVRTLSTFCDPNILNSPAPPDPFDPMRGELAFKASYTENGQLLESSTFMPQYQLDSLVTPGIISKFFVTGYMLASQAPTDTYGLIDGIPLAAAFLPSSNSLVPIGVNTFTEYLLQSAKKIKDSTITTVYEPTTGNYLISSHTIYYGSAYHHSPTRVSTYNSKGEQLVTNIKSTFDYRITNYNVADQLPAYYTNLNNDQSYLSNAMSGLTTDVSDPYYYWNRLNVFTNYRYKKAIDRQNWITYRRQNFTNPSNAYQTAHDVAKSSADAVLNPILKLQDEYINEPIETSQFKNNNLLNAQLMSYDYGLNSSSFVYPSKQQTITLSSPSNTFSSSIIVNNSISKDNRYTDETWFNYSGGNLVSVKKRDGVINRYLWGYNNQYPVAKIMGSDYATAFNQVNSSILLSPPNDDQLQTELSHLRQNLPLAQLTSYTYSPLLGITSQTDPSGHTNNYEYDALGRLKLIRDLNNNILKKYDYQYNLIAVKVYTASEGPLVDCSPIQGCSSVWTCTYHYERSDGSRSQNYTERSPAPCAVTIVVSGTP